MNHSEDFMFKEALRTGSLTLMRRVPKTDVHNHGVLGMRRAAFNKSLGAALAPPPSHFDGISGFDEYIFEYPAKYVHSSKQLAGLLIETVLAAIEDGVTVLESSLDIKSSYFFNSCSKWLSAIARIRDNFSDRIDFRPELGMSKATVLDDVEAVLVQCVDSGVFQSLDLYGDESIVDFDRFKAFYAYAKGNGLKLKVHVGEFCGPEIVRKAIAALQPDEIQHGIGIVGDSRLIDEIKEKGIRLNICPRSNIALGAVSELKQHPIGDLFRQGVSVSINTDDLLIFNQSVSEAFFDLYQNALLGPDELNEIRKAALPGGRWPGTP